MFKYCCERQGCSAHEKNIPCLKCANSFYCSIKCRSLDSDQHSVICYKTNTRDIINKNTHLIGTLWSILTKFSNKRKGVINIRSYNHIATFLYKKVNTKLIQTDRLIVELTCEENTNYLYITFIPLDKWIISEKIQVPVVNNNDYNERIVVNINIEGMNKPQLFRLPIKTL